MVMSPAGIRLEKDCTGEALLPSNNFISDCGIIENYRPILSSERVSHNLKKKHRSLKSIPTEGKEKLVTGPR
jgi:hypothetical protein